MKPWIDHVQYRAVCDDCGEYHMVAIVSPRHKPRIRLCERCYGTEFWLTTQFYDARWLRHELAMERRFSTKLMVERDHARDLAAAMVTQPWHGGHGYAGVICDGPAADPFLGVGADS